MLHRVAIRQRRARRYVRFAAVWSGSHQRLRGSSAGRPCFGAHGRTVRMSLRVVKASAVLAGLALGAVACGGGGGDGSGAAPTATVDEGVKQGVEQALSSASTPATPATAPTAAAPTTMAAADARWATQ